MPRVYRGRYSAEIDEGFVVFLIGMRVNKAWKLHKWIPVFRAMPPMLAKLSTHPDKGLLGYKLGWIGGPAVVQYWRSFEDLEHFARNPGDPHLGAWRAFNRTVRNSGDVGIWHETYQVQAGAYECVYSNMPRFGLAAAAEHVPASRRGHSAAKRIGASDTDEVAVPYYENLD